MHALDGLRVVDFGSSRAGGMASAVLADFGADVTRVMRPGGDVADDSPSAPLWLRNKSLVEIDLASAAGQAEARRLAAGADVALIAAPPARVRAWGLDAPTLRSEHPGLIHCAITGWGMDGPYADLCGLEGVVAAKAGRMAAFDVQLREGRPVYSALAVATHIASQTAVHGILAALHRRHRTGVGAAVETSLWQGLVPFDLMDVLTWQLTRDTDEEFVSVRKRSEMPTLNYHPVPTADGKWIQCGNLIEHLFYSFLGAIDVLGDLLADERFTGSPATWTPEAVEVARDLILTRTQEKTAAEWMSIFAADGNVAAEPILSTAEAIEHADLVDGGCMVTFEDPIVGQTTQIGPIAELTMTPASTGPRRLSQPFPDQPTNATEPPVEMTDTLDGGAGPLAGVTILDLATIIAGPLGMSMLADLGARVIKIEPFGGDPFRQIVPGGLMATKMNQGKESICIDLKKPEGQAVLHELVAGADVVVHNFRGDVPNKLGLAYEQLRSITPDIISAVINGYGPHGPSAKRPATHPVMGAACGGVALQAGAALARPMDSLDDVRETARQLMAANEANPDPNTSVVAASAILLALAAKDRHGVGQQVNVNMQVANAWANGDDFLTYAGKPDRLQPDADLHGLHACYRLYPTADGWVFLAALTDAAFARLAAALTETPGAGLDSDYRFTEADSRRANDGELTAELTKAFAARSADEWESLLTNTDVGCVRADGHEVADVLTSDPHVIANGWAPTVTHTRFGPFQRWGPVVTVDGLAESYRTAPLAGEHTDALLSELGKSPEQITSLRSERVVNSELVVLDDPASTATP